MISFVKAHACGNDFLILDEALAKGKHAELARKLCSRNTSIGADGIEFVEWKKDGTFFLRLFNADGSEAELSGNGTRCVAAWLAMSEGLTKVVLGTHGGPRTCAVIEDAEPQYRIESDMGVPRVMPRTIVVPEVGNVEGAMVNVGNPHFVVFVDAEDFSTHGLTWQALGEKISTSPLFPHGTNVEFVRVLSHGRDRLPHLRARLRPDDLVGHGNLRVLGCGDGAARREPRAERDRAGRSAAHGLAGERRGDAADRLGRDHLHRRGAGRLSATGYLRPKALRPGATLAVLSPASTPKPELVQQGIARLEQLGYETVLGEHALDRGPLYYAGTLEQRLADLHAAFADPAIDGIICTRGGWGSAELLPHLDVGADSRQSEAVHRLQRSHLAALLAARASEPG